MDDRAREIAELIRLSSSTSQNVRLISAYGDEREREALKPALERIEALESLLVCYRVGNRPTEALHKKLERTRIAVESIRSVIKTAPEGKTK